MGSLPIIGNELKSTSLILQNQHLHVATLKFVLYQTFSETKTILRAGARSSDLDAGHTQRRLRPQGVWSKTVL